MKIQINYNDQVYHIDLEKGRDLSIRNDFSGNAPTFFGAEQPEAVPQHSGDFIGDWKVEEAVMCPLSLAIFIALVRTRSVSLTSKILNLKYLIRFQETSFQLTLLL